MPNHHTELYTKNWKRNFFTIWTGQAVSKFSSSVLQFAMIWYLTDTTDSAAVVSFAVFLAFFPQAILGPIAGVVIDRYNRKLIMILSDVLIALVGLAMAIAGYSDNQETWMILMVLFLRTVGTAFHSPCMQAVTPQIVPSDQLTKCAGYSQALTSVSDIFSPAAAALLYQIWSLETIVMLDVIGALCACATLAIAWIPKLEKKLENKKIQFIAEAVEGFHVLKKNKGVFGLVMVTGLYTIALMPVSALFPLMSMSYFGGTSTHASITEIVFSVGFMMGSLVLSAWGGTKNRVYTVFGSYMLMAVSLLVAGSLPTGGYWFFVICSWLIGFSGPFYWGTYTPILQTHYEGIYLGRVLSLTGSVRYLFGPLGLGIESILSTYYGPESWFIIGGVLVFISALLLILVPSIRKCDEPETFKLTELP